VGALIQTGIFSPSMIYASDISEKRLDILNKTYGISVMQNNFKVALLYNSLDNDSIEKLPIIRVMPNTPALVLAGMSGMSANKYTKAEDLNTIKIILEAIGKVIEFQEEDLDAEEEDLDAVTALSGSGPAYVFYIAEAMIEGGIKVGLEPDKAAMLTVATIQGALKLMEESNESPEILRRKVTSPGGTTEAAFKVLEKNRVKQNVIEAIKAATIRSKELSR